MLMLLVLILRCRAIILCCFLVLPLHGALVLWLCLVMAAVLCLRAVGAVVHMVSALRHRSLGAGQQVAVLWDCQQHVLGGRLSVRAPA
jgi:hypothetical protein